PAPDTSDVQPGNLEFRILANERDDPYGVEAARKYLHEARNDPARKAELDKLAAAGQTPPPPVPPKGDEAFGADLGRFNYTWMRVGPAVIREWAGEDSWKETVEARDKGLTFGIREI